MESEVERVGLDDNTIPCPEWATFLGIANKVIGQVPVESTTFRRCDCHDKKMSSDVVFIDGLQLSADVGSDCWGRRRPQPVIVSVYLHLQPEYLTRSGELDDVQDSVHYGHLAKAVTALVASPDAQFGSVGELASAVTDTGFKLAGEAAREIRVRVEMPKMVLLAGNFAVEVVTVAGSRAEDGSRSATVTDLSLSAIIGVNPPERKAKQRVLMTVVFRERNGLGSTVDYPSIVAQISEVGLCPSHARSTLTHSDQHIEASSYLTLEKLVHQVAQMALSSTPAFISVTVRAQKPSALSFARCSGVEITRE